MQESDASLAPPVRGPALASRRGSRRLGLAFGALALLGAISALPMQTPGQPVPGPPGTPAFSAPQLDQMLAPIALYPDELLGQILTAATYPLEVVQADRWLQGNPSNSGLAGADLADALQQQPWDASVKSLVPFPQILRMMDNDLDWTETLGDAFLAQQGDVMDAVQQLRARAQEAGTLASTPEQTVTNDGQVIEIAPPDANEVYVPAYDPDEVYGDWPYPDYPPYDFVFPGYPFGVFIGFRIFAPFWGWNRWDWHHHRLNVGGGGAGFRFPPHPGPWQHDPGHRGGVPYRDPATRARYEGDVNGRVAGGEYRGYGPATGELWRPSYQGALSRPPQSHPPQSRLPQPAPAARPAAPRYTPEPVARPSAPAYESYGRGPQVQMREQRGASSRVSAPSGGGGGGKHR